MTERRWLVLWLIACLAVPAGADSLTKLRSRAYTIYTDLPAEQAREIASHMDGVYREYTRRLARGGFSANRRTDLPLYLFATPEAYVAFMASKGINAQNTGGMFFVMPQAQGLAAFTAGQSRTRLYHTLQHEGFHQFAYLRISPELPIWANEGLAEYFGDALLIRRRFVLGQVDPLRLQHVRQAIENQQAIPFATMIHMTPREWSANVQAGGDAGHLQYAQAWSMVHFLVHARPAYQKAFMAYLTNIHRGVPSGRAFEQAFGSSDYRSFQQAWLQYVADLEPDALTTAAGRLMFLAQGLKMLRARNESVNSMDQLRQKLQAVNFRVRQVSHASVRQFHASDEVNFQPPDDPDSRLPASITLSPGPDPQLPPRIVITGLKATVRLEWELDQQAQPVEQIVFQ